MLNHVAGISSLNFSTKAAVPDAAPPGSYPYEDVEELRCLIDTGLAYEMSHRRHLGSCGVVHCFFSLLGSCTSMERNLYILKR